jgi:hypothetical protein
MAKSRLAPIKQLTIPRLELQAATLATRQDALLRQELGPDLDLTRSQYWTDSTIVLQYIRNDEARYHTFVANRVAEIQERTEPHDWHHVPTLENPADDASRGVSPSALTKPRWIHGPPFLVLEPQNWPTLATAPPLSADDPEIRKPRAVTFATQEWVRDPDPLDKLIENCSNWTRLLRAIACFMALAAVKLRQAPKITTLQPEHLQKAENALIAHIQQQHYGVEITALRSEKNVTAQSPLARLHPQLKEGLLVTTGRLSHARSPRETKHPAILPRHGDLSCACAC